MVTHDVDGQPTLRILVADDNRDAADAMCMLLQVSGYEALACYDGETVLQQVFRFQPHVLLQDIAMPGIDGLEVARRLRALDANRRLVMVAFSGFGEPDDLQKSREAGFEHYLVKPVDFGRVRQILDSVRARIESEAAQRNDSARVGSPRQRES